MSAGKQLTVFSPLFSSHRAHRLEDGLVPREPGGSGLGYLQRCLEVALKQNRSRGGRGGSQAGREAGEAGE